MANQQPTMNSGKIEKLTKEQEARLDEYRDKFIAIGLRTYDGSSRPDHGKLRNTVSEAYVKGGLKPPHLVVWLPGGPASCALALDRLEQMDDISGVDEITFGELVAKEALEMGEDKLHEYLAKREIEFSCGSHDASWLSVYAYFREVVGLEKETEDLLPLMGMLDYGWWIAHENVAIVSMPPVEYCFARDAHTLHKDGGPAVRYADGWGVYVLNGVSVPKTLAITPEEKLNPREVGRIQNAEVRREFVRKVGIDRICHSCGAKAIDKETVILGNGQNLTYELLNLKIDGIEGQRPYLKMLNPSEGTWHVEGVPPGTATVKQALAWRNGTAELPHSLT